MAKTIPNILNFYQLDTKKALELGVLQVYIQSIFVHCFEMRGFLYQTELAFNHVLYRGQVLEILLNGLVEPGRTQSK